MTRSELPRPSTSLTEEQAFSHAATLHQAGQLEDADRIYRAILNVHPENAQAHNNLGFILGQLGKFDDAINSYLRALNINPSFHLAARNLCAILIERGRYTEIRSIFTGLGKLEDAISICRSTIETCARLPGVYRNIGAALQDLGQFDDAIESYRRALDIDPDYVEAHYNLANVLKDVGQIEGALISYRRALNIDPDFRRATWNLGIALLGLGRYDEGWKCNEIRFSLTDADKVAVPDLPFQSWYGEPLIGRSIVIIEEQGIGDDIQFCRYASTLKQMGAARVSLVCKNRLRPLFSRMKGIDAVFERGDISTVPQHDFWSFAQSLPLHCGTTVETAPADVPYLFADAALTERIASEFGRSTDLKIGICWKGSAAYPGDAARSPGLGFFKPIFSIDGVRIFTLLPNSRAELIGSAGDKAVDIGHEVDELTAPFEETAALIMNLDLVITSDTSICHLAGALGKPVWLVLPYAAHWVWMTDREDSPWYPNTRLFRQTERGNWAGVFERVAQKLRAVLAGEMPLVWPVK